MLAFQALAALTAPPPPVELVQFAPSTRFCADEEMQGPCFYLSSPEERGPDASPIALRYRGEQGDVFAVEVVDVSRRERCAGSWDPLAPQGLRIYAARSDALPSTTREVALIQGGDAAFLEEGTPLLPAGEGLWRVYPSLDSPLVTPGDDALSPPLPIPADAVGLRYPPRLKSEESRRHPGQVMTLAPEADLVLLGQSVQLRRAGRFVRLPEGAPPGTIELSGTCARYQMQVDPAFILPQPPRKREEPSYYRGHSPEKPPKQILLPKGLPLTWSDGRRSGRLSEEPVVYLRDGRRSETDDVCWRLPVGYPAPGFEPDPAVWACVFDPDWEIQP